MKMMQEEEITVKDFFEQFRKIAEYSVILAERMEKIEKAINVLNENQIAFNKVFEESEDN